MDLDDERVIEELLRSGQTAPSPHVRRPGYQHWHEVSRHSGENERFELAIGEVDLEAGPTHTATLTASSLDALLRLVLRALDEMRGLDEMTRQTRK